MYIDNLQEERHNSKAQNNDFRARFRLWQNTVTVSLSTYCFVILLLLLVLLISCEIIIFLILSAL